MFAIISSTVARKRLVFLVDTGSQVSIIKAEKILDAKFDTRKRIEITGIAENKTIKSLGTTVDTLNFGEFIIEHKFHVMHENLFLKADGILGADFLVEYNALIDLSRRVIILR